MKYAVALVLLSATSALAQGVPNNVGGQQGGMSSRQMLDMSTCMLSQPPQNLPVENMAYCMRLHGNQPRGANPMADSLIDQRDQRNRVVQCYDPFRYNEVRSFKGRCPVGWYPLR